MEENYEAIIVYIQENVESISVDTDLKQIYGDTVEKYKEQVLAKADELIISGEYDNAEKLLSSAGVLIGEDTHLTAKRWFGEAGNTC